MMMAIAVTLVSCTVMAQHSDPEKEAFMQREQAYIRMLQDDLRMPDFAAKVIEDVKKVYPDAGAALKVLELQGLLSQGKFDEVKKIILSQRNQDAPETWAMWLAMADAYYAFGRNDESFGLYNSFFKKFPQPTPELESFYIDAAYKYPQMLLQARLDKMALEAYKRLLGVKKLPGEVIRQVQADAAELTVRLAEAETNKKTKEEMLKDAEKLADQLLWDQDMWFGKGIVIKAHIQVLKGNAARAQTLIEEYMGPLKAIHDSLVAQEREDGVRGLVKMSPMAQCRFLLAVMLQEEAMKVANTPGGDMEIVKNYLLGQRDGGNRKPNGAYQHFINVFVKFPDSQWAMEAGEREQEIRAFIREKFGQELRPMITAEMMDRIRQKQFEEAQLLFAGNNFEAAIPIFIDVLNRFPETTEAVRSLSELVQSLLETKDSDGYNMLLSETVTGHLAERFCLGSYAMQAGNEVLRLAEKYGSLGYGDKRQQTYDTFFANFTTHPEAAQRLMNFGVKALESGDDATALGYFERLTTSYTNSAWYGDALSQIAAVENRRQNYTNEIEALNVYIKHLQVTKKPGLALSTARFRVAQATRQQGLSLIREQEDEEAQRAGSMLLLRAAVLFDNVGKELDAIPSGVAIDTKQANLFREQASLQKAASLAQVVAPAAILPRTRPQAITAFLSFAEEFPKSEHVPAALMKAGTLYTVLKETEKAQDIFTRLRREFPESEEARSSVPMLAASLMELGLRGDAIAKYKEMFVGGGTTIYTDYQILTAARALLEAREYDVALQGFDKVIAAANEVSILGPAHFGRAQALISMKRHKEARLELEAFIKEHGKSSLVVDAYLLLADAASAEGESERDNKQRDQLFNKAIDAFKFARNYRTEIKDMLDIDLQVGQAMIRQMNADKAFGLEDLAANSRGKAIIAFKQLIFATDPRNAVLAPQLEKAFLLSIPLELEHKQFEAAAESCEEYLETFGSSRNAPQVRTWLNQAQIEIGK